MAAEFVFRISNETILIDDKKTGYHLELRNSALVNRKNGIILALGERESVVRERLGRLYERQAGNVEVIQLFGPDGRYLVYEIRALEHFTRLLHQQGQQASARNYFAAKAMQGFCNNRSWVGAGYDFMAKMSYEMADAMMESRK